jgi:hypothetical protein
VVESSQRRRNLKFFEENSSEARPEQTLKIIAKWRQKLDDLGKSGEQENHGRIWKWSLALDTKRHSVDDCRVLDVNGWTREGILREGIHHFGRWKWCNAATGEETSSVGYEVKTTDMAFPYIRLYYTFTQTQEHMDYTIRLQTAGPYVGGFRWWFTCPLLKSGSRCNHRVSKLYLPSGGRYYGCRHCDDLTYQSCQESDKRVSFLR